MLKSKIRMVGCFFLLMVSTLSHANLRIATEMYQDEIAVPEIIERNGVYLINLPKPNEKGVSLLYLDADESVLIKSVIAFNNGASGLYANDLLEGESAKTIRVQFKNTKNRPCCTQLDHFTIRHP